MNKRRNIFLIGIVIVCSLVWQLNILGSNFYEFNDKDRTSLDLDKVAFIWKEREVLEIYFGLFEGAIISLWKLEYWNGNTRNSDYKRLLKVLNSKQLPPVTGRDSAK